jgi:hypothetical protein
MAIIGRLFAVAALADVALARPLAARGVQQGWTDAR